MVCPVSDPENIAVQVLETELAEHGDGAQATAAAVQASGLPVTAVRELLDRVLNQRRGGPPIRVKWRPRAWRGYDKCPDCGKQFLDVPSHRRRKHRS